MSMQATGKQRQTTTGKVAEEILAFTVGRDPDLDLALVEADCIGTAAHAVMLAALPGPRRVLTAAQKDRVIRELLRIIELARAGRFKIRMRDQDVHMAVDRVLMARLGDVGRRIHTASSRNDQVAVDLRLYAKEQLHGLMDETASLAGGLLRFAKRHDRTPMVGRTHMQPAMPSTVGLWAAAHAESLLDDVTLVRGAYDYNDRSPLGSAAGYGVPMPIDRALTARLLGFQGPIRNVLYASHTRGKCETIVLGAVSQVMLSLSRLAADMILYTLPELGYFRLAPEHGTGSSIMPQKNNPDVLELVRARTAMVLGWSAGAGAVLSGLPGGYNRDLQETKEPFLRGLETARACLRVMRLVIDGLKADRAALGKGFTPQVFAAEKALELVARGVPFRTAYRRVKEHLDELREGDLLRPAAGKDGPAAPRAPDLPALENRVRTVKKFVAGKRKVYHKALSKLLGTEYPKLRG